jgi:hypothetical protein
MSATTAAGGWRSLLRLDHHARRHAAVYEHQRAMALLIEEEAHGEIAGAFRVDDIRLAFVRLCLAAGAEFDGQRCGSRQQERESGPREVGVRLADRLCLGVAGRRLPHADDHAGRRVQRPLVAEQRIAVQSLFGDDRRVADRVHRFGPQQLVGQLQIDGYVAAHLSIPHRALVGSSGGQPVHGRQVPVSAERRARLRHQLLGLRIAGRPRRESAGGHRDRHQIDNQSLHVITSLSSMTSCAAASCYLQAIVL